MDVEDSTIRITEVESEQKFLVCRFALLVLVRCSFERLGVSRFMRKPRARGQTRLSLSRLFRVQKAQNSLCLVLEA